MLCSILTTHWMLLLLVMIALPVDAEDFFELFNSIFDTYNPCGEATPRCFLGIGYFMHQAGNCTASIECVLTPFLRPDLVCGDCADDSFFVQVGFGGGVRGVPEEDRGLFEESAQEWSEILANTRLESRSFLQAPVSLPCVYPTTIHNVFVCASYGSIDGASGLLGRAGPVWLRGDSSLPVASYMTLDSEDVGRLRALDSLKTIVKHELAHCLGFGVLWERFGLNQDCIYSGAAANELWECESALQLTGDSCDHWAENTCLGGDLLSSDLVAGETSALSKLTLATFADLGYEVNYSRGADLPGCDCSFVSTGNATAEVEISRETNRGNATDITRTPNTAEAPEEPDMNATDVQGGNSTLRNVRRRLQDPMLQRRRRRRRLSQDMHNYAIEYGIAFLLSLPKIAPMDDLVYVGDQLVSVLVEEDNAIFGVIIERNEDDDENPFKFYEQLLSPP